MTKTVSTKAASTLPPKPPAVSKEEAERRAKSLVKGIIKEGEGLPTSNMTTPAWVKYYGEQRNIRSSPYGRGSAREFDYFEKSLMRHYVNNRDLFFDLVGQNPEVCAVLYPDQSGRIRIVHHLTTAVHGRPMIVGVDGLGSVSEVKALNMSVFSEEIELGEVDRTTEVPTFTEFMMQEFGEIKVTNASSDERNEDRITLGQALEGCPVGYMVHPLWLQLIFGAIGSKPDQVAKKLKEELKQAFADKQAGTLWRELGPAPIENWALD